MRINKILVLCLCLTLIFITGCSKSTEKKTKNEKKIVEKSKGNYDVF